jgi:hypothetical protein
MQLKLHYFLLIQHTNSCALHSGGLVPNEPSHLTVLVTDINGKIIKQKIGKKFYRKWHINVAANKAQLYTDAHAWDVARIAAAKAAAASAKASGTGATTT